MLGYNLLDRAILTVFVLNKMVLAVSTWDRWFDYLVQIV